MNDSEKKEAYYLKIKGLRAALQTDLCRECPCPKTYCEWHGDCQACIRLHRINGEHIPNCLQSMLEQKVKELAAVAELTVSPKSRTPPDYWAYVRQQDGTRED